MNRIRKVVLIFIVQLLIGQMMYAQLSASKLVPYRIGSLWGYADRKGNIVIPTRYQEAFPFFFDKAVVKQDGHMSIIDENGDVHMP